MTLLVIVLYKLEYSSHNILLPFFFCHQCQIYLHSTILHFCLVLSLFFFYLTIVKTCLINVTSSQLIFKANGLFSVVLFDLSVAHKCFGLPLFHELTRSLKPQHTALPSCFLILFTVRSSAFLRLPLCFLVLPWLQRQLTSFASQLSSCCPFYSPDLARATSPSDS